MPEGDTIWRTAAALRTRLVGKRLDQVWPPSLGKLRGRLVTAVEPAGKHLLIRFEGNLALHSHMRMTGGWHIYAPGERWRAPEHRARAILRFPGVTAVCFATPVIELVPDSRRSVAHLGPDILAEAFDLPAVLQRARSAPDATIAELLLDQRVCAGLGNIYKCEALWVRQVDPWTMPTRLDDETLGQLYLTARDLMRRNLSGLGFRHSPAVHGRGGRPCPRCGTPIRVRSQGALPRLTFWCPTCQTMPSP